MAAKKKPKASFEEGMASLDELVLSMQKGDMPLEELMGAYEKGMALAAQLDTMLKEHRRRIEQIDPATAEITSFEENEHGVS